MSLIHEHNQLKRIIEDAHARIAIIETDPQFASDKEFETKLRSLLAEYHRSLRDVKNLLDPESRRPEAFRTAEPKTRRARQVMRYTHPDSGEIVDTKGGNHRTLKAWNEKFGKDVVKGWGKPL